MLLLSHDISMMQQLLLRIFAKVLFISNFTVSVFAIKIVRVDIMLLNCLLIVR